MGFGEVISTCLSKYVTFGGRAPCSEYCFFTLLTFIFWAVSRLNVRILEVLFAYHFITGHGFGLGLAVSVAVRDIIWLVLLLPHIAVSVRRLHDIDRTGWGYLLGVIPLIGWIVLLVWFYTRGTVGPNHYGRNPLAGAMGTATSA
jgi:uncharacterized membrane protein YhaH (DUF805 family)